MTQTPAQDLDGDIEEDFDEAYEEDAPGLSIQGQNLADALEVPVEDTHVEANRNPLDDYAALAVPKILSLTSHLESENLRNELYALPIVQELMKLTVTQSSLKTAHTACKTLQRYKEHDDPGVNVATKQLLGAWRKILALGAASKYTSADDALNSTSVS